MTKDFSRMFEKHAATSKQEPKMPDYSSMFPKQNAVVGSSPAATPIKAPSLKSMFAPSAPVLRFKNANEILEWRRDLSDKVREHVDLVERLIRSDNNAVANAEALLSTLSDQVAVYTEATTKWTLFKPKVPQIDLAAKVRADLDKLSADLQLHRKPDPFKLREVDQMVEQATYLSDQLAKAGAELEKAKATCSDDVEIDMINRRCNTLFTQQQLVAIGAEQVKNLAADIRTRPSQVDDLLGAAIPMCRKLCLDVLAGTKQASELRKKP